MALKYRRLLLVKKYLLISLLLSITPLLISALLYDRYTASLLDNILAERLESDVEASAESMRQFLGIRANRLGNLADIPEIEQVFSLDKQRPLSENLLDFIYLEVGSADVYSVSFISPEKQLIRSIPSSSMLASYSQPTIRFNEVDIIPPVFYQSNRPAWFGIQRDVFKGNKLLGSIMIQLRLASLTELAGALYRRDFYEPYLQLGNHALSVLALPMDKGEFLTSKKAIIPGWDIALIKNAKSIEQPRVRIRYLLLCIVALACVAIILVFLHLSEKLAGLVLPLTEGARAIAKGDFSLRVPEKAPGELKELAHAFNQMSEQLVTMIDSRVDTERRGALGNLAAGIAHEIRNPLTTLRTSIHALSYNEPDKDKQEMFSLISEEILRLDAMVEEFLSYARPHEPCVEDVVIKDLLHSIDGLTSATLSEANIRIHYLGDQSIILRVDPAQLRQVLMNLILNAIDAMPNGGNLTIRTEKIVGEQGQSQAMMTLSDDGIGMDKNILDKIQAPFFTTKAEGTGLGLSICAQVLRRNGGMLSIESVLGEGTRVYLLLRVNEEE